MKTLNEFKKDIKLKIKSLNAVKDYWQKIDDLKLSLGPANVLESDNNSYILNWYNKGVRLSVHIYPNGNLQWKHSEGDVVWFSEFNEIEDEGETNINDPIPDDLIYWLKLISQ